METFSQMKARHQAEVNALPLGFAFGQEQFREMLAGWGLTEAPEDLKQIVFIGAGGYIRRKDLPLMRDCFDRQDRERKQMQKNRKELKKQLIHEMYNYECQIGGRFEEALNACGLTLEDLKESKELTDLYNSAYKQFWKECHEQDNF